MRFFFNGVSFSRTRVHCLVLLAVGLLFGNQLPAFAYQTGDPTMTGYTLPSDPTMTSDPTMGGTTPPLLGDPNPTPTPPPPTMSYAPFALDDWYQTSYNTVIYMDPLQNDSGYSAPLDPSSFTIELGPEHGTAVVDPLTGFVEYTPDTGFSGIDQFFYTIADTDGNVSNLAMVDISVINIPPSMISFIVTEGSANVWLFEGQVGDEELANCTIIFGGLLEGVTTTVNANGTFSFSKILTEYEGGGVSAQARDELGELSNILYGEVYHF